MNESLEQRKEKAKEFLKAAYTVQDKKWYQAIPTYRLIPETLENKSEDSKITKEIIIRNYTKGALKLSAFFVLLGSITYLLFKENSFGILVMFAIFIIINLISSLDKRPKIILNYVGLWEFSFEKTILWGNIFAIYHKTEDAGDGFSYSLILHYYDEIYDNFREIEMTLEGYELSNEEIIDSIKQFY
jgi:hypothetical protein